MIQLGRRDGVPKSPLPSLLAIRLDAVMLRHARFAELPFASAPSEINATAVIPSACLDEAIPTFALGE